MTINNNIFIENDKIISYSINNESLIQKTLTIVLDLSVEIKPIYSMLKEAKELVINNNDDEVLTRSVLNRVYVDYFLNALIFKIGEEL